MSVLADVGRTYAQGPRAVVATHLARGPAEARVLALLMIGSLIVWIGQWPRLMREASGPSGPDFQQLAGTALVAWVMLVPLVFYLLAGVVHLASRSLGGQGEGWGARIAIVWAWIASSPLSLVAGLAAGATGGSVLSNLLAILWVATFAAFWAAGQREASSSVPLS